VTKAVFTCQEIEELALAKERSGLALLLAKLSELSKHFLVRDRPTDTGNGYGEDEQGDKLFSGAAHHEKILEVILGDENGTDCGTARCPLGQFAVGDSGIVVARRTSVEASARLASPRIRWWSLRPRPPCASELPSRDQFRSRSRSAQIGGSRLSEGDLHNVLLRIREHRVQ
jgi:hypothetical protein